MQKRIYPSLQNARNTEKNAAAETAKLIVIEKSEKLQLGVSEDISENLELNWSSSDQTIASVDPSGLVTPIEIGETLITVTSKDNEYEESIYISVEDDSDSKTYRLTVELKAGDSCKVQIRGTVSSTIRWNSMRPSIASVTEDGRVKAAAVGLTVLTAVSTEGVIYDHVYIRVR